MAEGPFPREEPLEDLEKEITCAICQDVYNGAKLLPCNHYYCSACIEKMAARSRSIGVQFSCPECRKEANLSPGGTAELQPAFFVERLKDVYGKIARSEGKTKVACGKCAATEFVAFCSQCSEFLCEKCLASHEKQGDFTAHDVTHLKNAKNGERVKGSDEALVICEEHDEVKKLYCFDCECLICRDCTIINHKDHDYEFSKKCASERRNILRESLTPLLKVKADLANREQVLESEEEKVERQKVEVIQSIRKSFDILEQVLDSKRKDLENKASQFALENKNTLHSHKLVLQAGQKEVHLLTEQVQQNIECMTDFALIHAHTQLLTQIEEKGNDLQQLLREPVATSDITCNLPSPDVISQQLGEVFSLHIPRMYTNPKNTMQLGSPVQATLCALSATVDDISVTLIHTANQSSSQEGEVVANGMGIFNISVTPLVRGYHYLTVKVKGQEVEGSPFRIFVVYPPSQLGKKCRKIGSFAKPWGIAVSNKHLMVVGETGSRLGGRKITVMERDGRKVQTIESPHFSGPRGVAVDSQGAIYVTDPRAKCLFKFNSEGGLLKAVRNELQEPYSVKIIDNQLYVMDMAKKMVVIFDLECSHVIGTIQTRECSWPMDIAQGPDGLYVAAEAKICVYECAPNGVFLRQLNLSPTLKLSWFRCICFDVSGHIIASDRDNGVYVFEPSGKCINHISTDIVSSASGLCVDEHGFINVCQFSFNGCVCIL